MLTPEQIDAILDDQAGERVTAVYIQSRIASVSYLTPTPTLTLCLIQLDNGFVVTGESACVDPANYRKDIGEAIAHDKAFAKLWALFGFLLTEARFRRSNGPDDGGVNAV